MYLVIFQHAAALELAKAKITAIIQMLILQIFEHSAEEGTDSRHQDQKSPCHGKNTKAAAGDGGVEHHRCNYR